MDRLNSSAMDWADFRPSIDDPSKGALRVHFKGRDYAYTYHNVLKSLYKEFLEAESQGQFYHSRIKYNFEETREDV